MPDQRECRLIERELTASIAMLCNEAVMQCAKEEVFAGNTSVSSA